jgi:nucleoside-diphosphate-sugar epimerase
MCCTIWNMTVPETSLDLVITGADGWLGRSLLQVLQHPHASSHAPAAATSAVRVRGLTLTEEGAARLRESHPGGQWMAGDLRDPATAARLLEGARGAALVHMAGIIHPQRVSDFHAVHVEGSTALWRQAVRQELRRMVVVSSNSPCGANARPQDMFDENSPYRPYMGYGRSKMEMEQALRALAHQDPLELVVVRAPWFYGPHQPERQTRFFRMIRDGRFPIVGSGENRRSMAYTETLADGLLRAARLPQAAGQTYWMADARPYSMLEIVGTVARLLETEFGQRCAGRAPRVPGLVADTARLADRLLQAAGLYVQEVHVLSEMNLTIACSIDKARRELGFEPVVDLEEGMRRSLRWVFETYGKL